jgi:hypothetical protein
MKKSILTLAIILFFLFLGPGCAPQSMPIDTNAVVPDLDPYPWVYLRDGQPLGGGEQPVSVIAVGDVLLGRGVTSEVDPLSHTVGWLQNADLALGNLEGVLVDGGSPRQAPEGELQPIILKAAPTSAKLLPQAGFDIMGLANNHSLDYGDGGLQETIRHLQRAGLVVIGVENEGGTAEPLIQEIGGFRLAFLAFNALSDPHPQPGCPPLDDCPARPMQWDPAASPQVTSRYPIRFRTRSPPSWSPPAPIS